VLSILPTAFLRAFTINGVVCLCPVAHPIIFLLNRSITVAKNNGLMKDLGA